MVQLSSVKSDLKIKPTVEQILAIGQMSRKEHLWLISAMLSDSDITSDDRRRINYVFDCLQTGRVKLV
jgi:hypothetical protein